MYMEEQMITFTSVYICLFQQKRNHPKVSNYTKIQFFGIIEYFWMAVLVKQATFCPSA